MTKKILLLLLLSIVCVICKSQFYKSVLPSPAFTSALEKIVIDFRFNFKTIRGESLARQEEMETYESVVKLPGASECVIYQSHSVEDTTAGWQGVMYRGEDYGEAERTYQNTFRLVKKSHIKWIDKSLVGFAGELELPKEEVRFAQSTLEFELNDTRYKNFKAEVEIISTYAGWEVHLNLHTKKPDEQG